MEVRVGSVSYGAYGAYGTMASYGTHGKLLKLSHLSAYMPRGVLKLTKEDKDWALQVKQRDGFKCAICSDIERLNSHHIIVREQHDTKLDLLNGITLCAKHHLFCRTISAHNNPLGFFIWLEKNRPEQMAYLKSKMELLLNDNA
jgi:hypothetical protein